MPTIRPISPSGNLQQILNNALPDDILEVLPGSVYSNLVWPVKPDVAPVTIRTANIDNNVAPGTRVDPKDRAKLGRLVSTGANVAAFMTQAGAHGVVLCGLEICPVDKTAAVSELVKLGSGGPEQNSLDKIPSNILIDRCYIHGLPGADLKRGISLQSALTTIRDSYISDCKGVGYDSQAVCGWNGPGPYKILNTYLEGAGENVMFGGADPYIQGLIPSDIVIDGCLFSKPLSWRVGDPLFGGIHYSVKNLFEIKNAQRVKILNSYFENSWGDGQVGFAISLKAVMQESRAPWSQCADVEFAHNTIVGAGGGFNIAGQTNKVLRLNIHHNVLMDIYGQRWNGPGFFAQITNTDGVTFDANTSDQTGAILNAYGASNSAFVFTNNRLPHNAYGAKGDGTGIGLPTLTKYFPGAVFIGNTIAGKQFAASYPAGNTFVDTLPVPMPIPAPTPVPVPPVPVPAPIPSPIPIPSPTGGQPVTINSSDPLAAGLILAVPFYDKDAPFVTEEVSGQEAIEGANGFVWQTPIDMPGTWGKYAVGVSQKTDCLKVSVYGDYWKAPPVAGFSAAACFKPTGQATSGVQRILDTDTIAGHVIYVDHDRNGPKLGWLTIMCSDAQGNPAALDFEYPAGAWLCVVKSVSMNLTTVYANWKDGAITPTMNVLADHACDLPRTWFGGENQNKLPKVQCLAGTIGNPQFTPNALVAQLNIWNRALTAEEVQAYRDNPKSMFSAPVVIDPGPVVVPPVIDPRDAQIADLTRQVSSLQAKLEAVRAALG